MSEVCTAHGVECPWKDQAGRDQAENRVLKARLAGGHATVPFDRDDAHSVPQLVEFMRYAARSAKDGKWGMWRATEFEQAADALEAMHESYVAVCFHEAEVERLRAMEARVRAVLTNPPSKLYGGGIDANGMVWIKASDIRAALEAGKDVSESVEQSAPDRRPTGIRHRSQADADTSLLEAETGISGASE